MFKTAFSTVACHDRSLDEVVGLAGEFGYDGLELRTFGEGATEFACDPALTSPEKLRQILDKAGVGAACVATSARFDAPIRPPVIGRVISDNEASVREANRAIDLAAQLECPFVRVFGFEVPTGERYGRALDRIMGRLGMVLDHARNTGVKLVIENGGSFPHAADVAEIIDRADSPLLGAAYSMAVAHAAGEDPAAGVNALGDRLWIARIKDLSGQRPAPLGHGDLPCKAFIEALGRADFAGWLVFEWDRAWLADLEEPEVVLPSAIRKVYDWIGEPAAV